MSSILIFAGTTEGRKLSERLCDAGIEHMVCVATEYGEIVLQENPFAHVHMGRMDCKQMQQFILDGGFDTIVDATHPYATVVTENIRAAVGYANDICDNDFEAFGNISDDISNSKGNIVSYIRLKRDTDIDVDYENITYFPDNEACEKALQNTVGNILLTTGSKELSVYCKDDSLRERLYVRVLPGMESISLCMENGITGKHILALQGPFSTKLNEALIDQFDIQCLVTKKSGAAGGWKEKIEAAKNKNIPVYVVGTAVNDEGMSYEAVCETLLGNSVKVNTNIQAGISEERIESGNDAGISDSKQYGNIKFNITLAGIGMGSDLCMTGDVADAIKNADILLGASRMIEKYDAKIEKKPYYLAKEIIPYLKKTENLMMMRSGTVTDTNMDKSTNVVVLFSGDTGFYSGAKKLFDAIKSEIESGRLSAKISVMPGISSVAYMAAAVGESYSDAYICSIHGVKLANIKSRISRHVKTFMLMSGVKDVNRIGHILSEDKSYGLSECTVFAGYRLSYPDEKILKLAPKECARLTEEGLYILLIKNPNPVSQNVTPHLTDDCFIREKVPMTKEEVRHVSVCKLNLKADSVLYDIGSGTGSIAIEAASLSDDISVFAIEQKENAVALIEKNKAKFELDNISIINAKAPDGLDELPAPTHAFIGGSGGNLKEIIDYLISKNPHIRIVINAISLETISEIREILSVYEDAKSDIVTMQVSRSKAIGNYHLMQAENPVWICTLTFGND